MSMNSLTRSFAAAASLNIVVAIAVSGCATTAPYPESEPTATTALPPEPEYCQPGGEHEFDRLMCPSDEVRRRLQEKWDALPAERKAEINKRNADMEAEWEEMERLGKDEYYAKKRTEIFGYDPGPGGPRGSGGGGCVYDPTMNWDWHDDMVCNGVRPYLLPHDDYVTRDELEWAAQEWLTSR